MSKSKVIEQAFFLRVKYTSKVLELPASFQRYGYTYRISVFINDQPYVFEPDKEGNYPVLGKGDAATSLLKAIADRLKQLSIN
ncbi:hypothetical protein LT679_01820 [Mucilaginibacter roseus]|uniref:Uncharacterized protein n=1 Tax=Mucilaginibacter roseus TaxID=1528868 RepID=A0ABS8TWW8_9SPHI|nr:hypothetical protein [Mucilaginibacter roseus]MCD8739326.1 hypothetical protein [Mucilaginibacter roseus]